MITLDDLKTVRENLPTNHLNTLYERLNRKWSKSLIEKVLRGDRNNDDVIMAALDLAEETRCKKIALKERINTIAS
jgi:hypothetical protein